MQVSLQAFAKQQGKILIAYFVNAIRGLHLAVETVNQYTFSNETLCRPTELNNASFFENQQLHQYKLTESIHP